MDDVARLGIAGQDGARNGGANLRLGERSARGGETLAQHGFVGVAERQASESHASGVGGRPSDDLGLLGLLDQFAGDQLPIVELAAALRLTRGLRELRLGLAHCGFGLRARSTLQLLQARLGLADSSPQVIGPQHGKDVALHDDVPLLHATLEHDGRDLAANLRARRCCDPAGRDDGSHEGAFLEPIDRHHRALPLAPSDATNGQQECQAAEPSKLAAVRDFRHRCPPTIVPRQFGRRQRTDSRKRRPPAARSFLFALGEPSGGATIRHAWACSSVG